MCPKRYEHSPTRQYGSLSAAQQFTAATGGGATGEALDMALGAALDGALCHSLLSRALALQTRECAGHVGPENLSVVVGSDPPGACRRFSAGHAVWVPGGV